MQKEKEYTGQGYELHYVSQEAGITITGFRGPAFRVEIPEEIEGKRVVSVDRKAFLSRKNLREIVLPDSVSSIGDWAFAYCTNLERITLPVGSVIMGRTVFLDCSKLEYINGVGWSKEAGYLLAAAVTALDSYYLLDTAAAGSEEWIRKWDARLLVVMEEDDFEGYQKQILCGEEDYGSTDVSAYLRSRRRNKVRLAMLRLLNPQGITDAFKRYLETYLKEHTKGCSSEETWEVLLHEYHHDMVRMDLFLELGCADENNMDAMLADMGEENPEMKARFLRYQDRNIGYQDFFGGLSL